MPLSATISDAPAGLIGVVPVLIGPLQALLAILPGLLLALAAAIVSVLVSIFRPRAMLAFVKLLWRLKIHLVVIAGCVAGPWWAAERYWPSGESPAAAQGGGGDWPIFRGGLARRGAAAGEPGPAAGGVNWARQAGEEWFHASPAVVGNRVYVASALLSAFDGRDGEGRIYCFDADTGAIAWAAEPTFKTGHKNYRATFSSPVVRGELLVCGEGFHFATGARVVCLETATGKLRWSFQTASHVECTPVVADVTAGGRPEPRVFVGAGDDGYYCLDLATGRQIWHLPGERYPDAETSLAVHENKVYAGLGKGGRALCVIDAAEGRELARADVPYAVFSPPSIADGKLFVGMGRGDFIEAGSPPAGEVWCVDLARLAAHRGGPLRPDWKIDAEATVLGSVAVAAGRVYFCTVAGAVHCADRRTGRPVARFDAHAPIKASPAVADRHVYVITEAGMLYGLDRRTLEPVWEYRVGTRRQCISSPAVARGRVYVGTQEDGFVCVGRPAKRQAAVWSGRLAGAPRAGNFFGSPPPKLGVFRWQYPPDQEGQTQRAVVAAPPAAVGDALFVPLAAQEAPGLACLPARADAEKAPEPKWVYRTSAPVFRSPAVVGDLAFCVDGAPGGDGRHVHAVRVADGTARWKAPVAPDATGTLTATAADLFVQDRPDGLTRFGLSGDRLWVRYLGGRLDHAPAVAAAMLVAATSHPPSLVALDRPTGAELWSIGLDAAPAADPWVHRDTVYLPTSRGLEARSLVDGSPRPPHAWQPPGGAVGGDVAVDAAHIVYVDAKGHLVVLDRRTGRPTRPPVPGARPGTAPLLGGGVVLYEAADGKIMKLRLAGAGEADGEGTPRPEEWADASWLGPAASPMVLSGTAVYVGRAGWGLVCLGEDR